MQDLDVPDALYKVFHVFLHSSLLALLCQQCSLHSVDFGLKLLHCSLSYLCLHLCVSEPLLNILDLLLQVFFSLSILITLHGETFHRLVHPSQLGLQHRNLSITSGSSLLSSVLVVLTQNQFANNLFTFGIGILASLLAALSSALSLWCSPRTSLRTISSHLASD